MTNRTPATYVKAYRRPGAVRGAMADYRANAGNAEFMRLLKLPENLRKTLDEIAAMVQPKESVDA